MLEYVRAMELEVRGVPWDYDHWQEAWSYEQNCPEGMRVGYMPYSLYGRHQLGHVLKRK